MAAALVITNLVKHFGRTKAVDAVSFSVERGEIFGFLGPNGAGKTTTLKAIVGALRPDSGSISVLDLDPLKQRWVLRRRIGYMPQESALYDDLPALDNVAFYARVHGVANPKQRAAELLTEFDLGERLRSPVFTLSGGMQKRVTLACALVHDPELYLLDEPTAALDPLLKRHMWERFRRLAALGKTIVMSTHLIDEAMLCDRVIILHHGRLVTLGRPREIVGRGLARVTFHSTEKTWAETIATDSRSVAALLHRHGLSSDINQLDIAFENLEDVMVKLLHEQEAR